MVQAQLGRIRAQQVQHVLGSIQPPAPVQQRVLAFLKANSDLLVTYEKTVSTQSKPSTRKRSSNATTRYRQYQREQSAAERRVHALDQQESVVRRAASAARLSACAPQS